MSDLNNKLKNYNQLLLAIGATLALLFFIGAIVFIAIDEFRRGNVASPEGIIATEETKELLGDSLRKQIVSFNNIELVDSARKLYLLPVRQAQIEDGESIDDMVGLTNSFTGMDVRYEKYSYTKNTAYNNLVLYESAQEVSTILFDDRISISTYTIVKTIDDKIYILISGTDRDSNKDKYLNRKDLQKLFIYSVDNKQLTEVKSNEKFTTINVYKDNNTKDIIGKFGLDRNDNGKFEIGREPMIFYKIDLKTKSLINILSTEQIEKLQKLLEGR